MIRVIHGDDEFSVSNALNRYLDALGPPDLREPNITVFEDQRVDFGEIMAATRVVPFLTKRRAVVVKDMLSALDVRGGKPRGDWSDFTAVIKRDGMAIVNELIFVDRTELKMTNAAMKALAAVSEVELHNKPKRDQMSVWLRERFRHHGAEASASAIGRLAYIGGDDTRRLDSEIEKLSLYADGRIIESEDVDLMVSDAHQEGIFRVMDAIIDGNPSLAMGGLQNLLGNGESIEGIFSLLSRQLRLLIVASDMLSSRTPREEIGKRLGQNQRWLVDKTCRQASNMGRATLYQMHRELFETDMQVKTGRLGRELAIEVVVAKLAGRVSAGASR